METLIYPDIFESHATAFFTGKSPGADVGRISETASIDAHKIYFPIQKHTDKIIVLDFDMSPKIADAVITSRKDVLLGVQAADCVPILLYDRAKSVIGTVHAGWRGTSSEILKKTIATMKDRFGSSVSDMLAAIGPSIRGCCYQVGHDVFESVAKATGNGEYHVYKGDVLCVDLAAANRYQAMSMGIPSQNIWTSGECTHCRPDRFYSYRYSKGSTGRQGGFIRLRQ